MPASSSRATDDRSGIRTRVGAHLAGRETRLLGEPLTATPVGRGRLEANPHVAVAVRWLPAPIGTRNRDSHTPVDAARSNCAAARLTQDEPTPGGGHGERVAAGTRSAIVGVEPVCPGQCDRWRAAAARTQRCWRDRRCDKQRLVALALTNSLERETDRKGAGRALRRAGRDHRRRQDQRSGPTDRSCGRCRLQDRTAIGTRSALVVLVHHGPPPLHRLSRDRLAAICQHCNPFSASRRLPGEHRSVRRESLCRCRHRAWFDATRLVECWVASSGSGTDRRRDTEESFS